ncbi:hypothetical protein EVAR_36968_1 [Eumeta japonica]|uniref:Uncharacterized protein n=1 Tax=Eumeta variegata TaxID=151549 RepID=A0A4C1W806_EUMVA|nr:hypothetical protein EVAR_36968_1 [Eumeta japonica]
MRERVIGFEPVPSLQGRPGVTENVDQPVFYRSSSSILLFATRPSPPGKPCRRDQAGASSTKSPLHPAIPSGPHDFVFYSASVGVHMQSDHCEMVNCLGVQVLDALMPDLGHVRRVKQIAEIHGPL